MIAAAMLANGHILVIADNGRVYQCDPASIKLCQQLQVCDGDVTATAEAIAAQHGVNATRVAHDMRTLLAHLEDAGLAPRNLAAITRSHEQAPGHAQQIDGAAGNSTMALAPAAPPHVIAAITAWVGTVAVRLALRTVPLRAVLAALRGLERLTREPATRVDVESALAAVDAAALRLPIRVACLERSITAMILLATRRRGVGVLTAAPDVRVTWHIGARTPPLGLHAWLSDADGPIAEPDSTLSYQPLVPITAPE